MSLGLTCAGGSKCKIQQVLTPGGTSRSTVTRVHLQEKQEEDNINDEDDVEDFVGGEGEGEDLEEELGFIEAEKRRRRMKRVGEEKQD